MTRSADGVPGRFIGAGIPGKTNRLLVTGKGTYVADIDLPDTVHMAVVRSPYAAAGTGATGRGLRARPVAPCRLPRAARSGVRAGGRPRGPDAAAPMLLVGAPPIDAATVSIDGRDVDVLRAITANTREWNFAGLPAVSVPCGFTTDGLPIAMQIVGRGFAEATVLRAARAHERRRPGGPPMPPL